MHIQSLLSLSAILGAAAAQTTTVSLVLPDLDSQPLVASVVGADATATTYVIQCAPGTDSTDCGVPGSFTLTEGPSTLAFGLKAPDFTMTVGCTQASKDIICSQSNDGAEANFPGSETTTFPAEMMSSYAVPVVVTAGLDKLSAATTGARPSANTATATAATSGFVTSTAGASTSNRASAGGASSASARGTASSATSAGGVAPQVTGNARWAVGGVAAALALAAV